MNIKVYDKAVNTSKLIGSNKEFLNSKLPHINNLLVDSVDNLCEYSKLLVLVHKPSQDETQKIIAFLTNTENIVLDSSINNDFKKYSNYHGINW
jgi:GDP-mannose 6-dehydrogenase